MFDSILHEELMLFAHRNIVKQLSKCIEIAKRQVNFLIVFFSTYSMDMDAFSPASSDGGQEDDTQNEYIVEALDLDFIVPEYVYDEDMEGDASNTATEGSETGGQIDDSGIDPTSIPSCSNECHKSKEVKLGAVTDNFTFNGQFHKRRFVGETSGGLIATRLISGNTVDEIITSIWEVSKPVLCREVIFIDNNGVQVATWADREPVFEDINKFIVLQDQNQKKRVNIENVTSKLLASWRSKQIRIHVHIYSTSISCKSLWEAVDKQLIRHQNSDRSGAPSNQAVVIIFKLNQVRGGCGQITSRQGQHMSANAGRLNCHPNIF